MGFLALAGVSAQMNQGWSPGTHTSEDEVQPYGDSGQRGHANFPMNATTAPKITPQSFPGTTPTILGKRHPHLSTLAPPSRPSPKRRRHFVPPGTTSLWPLTAWVDRVGDAIYFGSRLMYLPSCESPKSHQPVSPSPASSNTTLHI